MVALRLCLCVESTAKAGLAWQVALTSLLEPLLAMLEGPQHDGGCELALVLFGTHGGCSSAAVESSLTWCAGVAPFRALLAGLRFEGGGGQPVALADALLEAASLFACAGSGAPQQQHCLVWLASDPCHRPVPWPFADDCTVAQLPCLTTSAELCHVLRRRGIHLSLAGPQLLGTSHLLWHLLNLIADTPLSLADARWERLKARGGDAVQQQLVRGSLQLGGGAAIAALPFWPQALEMLKQQPGAKPLGGGSSLGGARGSAGSLLVAGSGETAGDTDGAAQRAGSTAATLQAAAAPPPAGAPAAVAGRPPGAPAPAPAVPGLLAANTPEGPPVVQWTPPGAAVQRQATPPAATPGSFWEVLNAEILSPDELTGPAPGAPPGTAPHAPGHATHEPAVAGLPMPPVYPAAQPQQQTPPAAQQPQQQRGWALPGQAPYGVPPQGQQQQQQQQGGAAKFHIIHTAAVVVDPKVTHGSPLLLGTAQVIAQAGDAPALRSLGWPAELHVSKTSSLSAVSSALASKPGCRRLHLKLAYAGPDAQKFVEGLLHRGAAGLLNLGAGMLGVLMPGRHQSSQQVALQLMLIPNAQAQGAAQ